MGVDVGEGISRSNTVAQVFDVTDLQEIRQVAIYASNSISPYHFGSRLLNLLIDWGRPPVLIETNNNGQQVLDVLYRTYNYENIVTYQPDGNAKGYKTENRKGIFNHTNTRYNGITNFRYWSNSLKVVRFQDLETLIELYNFVRMPNYTYTKRTSDNLDDRVLASVWALFILMPTLVTSCFSVGEYDNQGRPLKITSIHDNTELIKQSPLLTGVSTPSLKKQINVLPSVINEKNAATSAMDREAFELFRWLHQDCYSSVQAPKEPEDDQAINEYRPVIIF
jgi:hypothetical protein